MVKATVDLHITCQRWNKTLSSWSNPVKNSTFKTLGIITSCSRHAFGKLIYLLLAFNASNGQKIYQFRDNINLFFRTFHPVFFQTQN